MSAAFPRVLLLALVLATTTRATMEAGCYPGGTTKQLIFASPQTPNNIRVDVWSDGTVRYASGTKQRDWLSLTGMTYAIRGARALDLTSGWSNNGGDYQTATFSCADSLVSLSGLVRKTTTKVRNDIIGTLPEGCRPKNGRLAFTVQDASSYGRVDVDASGNVRWFGGNPNSWWISLNGVTFSTNEGQSLTFSNSWSDDTSEGFAPLRYTCDGGLVTVSGRVRAGRWGHCIAYLPSNCRPKQHVMALANNENGAARLTVRSSDGCIFYEDGGRENDRISLNGIVFFNGAARQMSPMVDWVNNGDGWSYAHHSCAPGGLVVIEGLVKNRGSWSYTNPILELPSAPPSSACPMDPPGGAMRFVGSRDSAGYATNTGPTSVLVSATGRITSDYGTRSSWLSLSNILWSNANRKSLALTGGWSNYGSGYSGAAYTCQAGIVTLSGLVKPGNWGSCLTTLPKPCRPISGSLLFSVDTATDQTRLKVRDDGCVVREVGPTAQGYLSLSGVVFATTQQRALEFRNNWRNYGGEWQGGMYSCVDGLVVLSGLIHPGTWQTCIAFLPAGCRPSKNLMFVSNHHQYSLRIDILAADGCIKHASGKPQHSWISLSGMAFTTIGAAPIPLNEVNWKTYDDASVTPEFSCARGVMSIQGSVRQQSSWSSFVGEVTYFSPPPSPPPPSPPPPSPPPPSPPPPSPPPGAGIEARATMTNPVTMISAYSFDLGVKVAHPSCLTPDDCFATSEDEEETKASAGLKCEVRVQRQGVNCNGVYGEFMPCRAWNDFSPKMLEMTDEYGRIVDGTYSITYSCYFTLERGQRVPIPQGAWRALHTFKLVQGCGESLSPGTSSDFENVARQLLLTSDEFNRVDCRDASQVYKAKEAVFRRHDNNPEDGMLSYDELVAAFRKQSGDVSILRLWNKAVDGALRLSPTHVMRVVANDMNACGSGTIVFDKVVYPSDSPGRESSAEECSTGASAMEVDWHYDAELEAGDYMCLYVDGTLFDKLTVFLEDPKSDMYSRMSNGVHAPSKFVDIRPISGSFDDVQQSLTANFLFDDVDESTVTITSDSPLVEGQSSAFTLHPKQKRRDFGRCSTGNGGGCMLAAKSVAGTDEYSYLLKGDQTFRDDVSLTSWVFSDCTQSGLNAQRTFIATFYSKDVELRFYLERTSSNKMRLGAEHKKNGSVKHHAKIDEISCGAWHFVGFSLNKRDKLVVFVDPTGTPNAGFDQGTFASVSTMETTVPKDILSVISTVELFGAVDVEFDDVRIYSGQVSMATFIDSYQCGHRPLCAKRAHATPSSRRVVCASATLSSTRPSEHSKVFCASGLYYDGSAIDVAATLDTPGVTFTFRDTSWQEKSFELLRKAVGAERGAASTYETIIQIDGDLKGCVNKFSSITYLDREAGNTPGLEWYYKVRTKMATAGAVDLVSTTHFFTVPWIGMLQGVVTAGTSRTPMPHVRVCAAFAWKNGTLMSHSNHSATNLALYMRVSHSGDITRTSAENTYVVTDGDASPAAGSSVVRPGEFLRVKLARWSSISRVELCIKGSVSASEFQVYVAEYEAEDSRAGAECRVNSGKTTRAASHVCFTYDCAGVHLKSYHGQYVTAILPQSAGEQLSVTEVAVRGVSTECTFTAVADDDGAYEFTLKDTTGRVSNKASVVVGAYREDVFPRKRVTFIDSTDQNSMSPARVLLIVRDVGASTPARAGSEARSRQFFQRYDADASSSISRAELSAFAEAAAGFPNKGHIIVLDSIWNAIDSNHDDELSEQEFKVAFDRMEGGKYVAKPILVYDVLNIRFVSNLQTGISDSCENFALVRTSSTSLPRNASAWTKFYSDLVGAGFDPFPTTNCDRGSGGIAAKISSSNATLVIPMLASTSTVISLVSSESDSVDESRLYSSVMRKDAVLNGVEQYDDIVHVFEKNTGGSATTTSNDVLKYTFSEGAKMDAATIEVQHRSVMAHDFADLTKAIVRGAVVFPKSRTAGSMRCGLYNAVIRVSEVDGGAEPEEYKTDEEGWFEMAVVRGKSYVFNATLPKHEICYSGKTNSAAFATESCRGRSQTVTLSHVGDGNVIFFTDVTSGNIDLGLYQGQCEALYANATFKVTPLNGCHSPVFVSSAEIDTWLIDVKDLPPDFTDASSIPRNARVWPFAAMDYSIMLDSGPSVGGVGDLITDEPWKSGCATEDGDMMTFFRRRNALERLALMRDNGDWQQIRYKYHGYICADIPEAYIPTISSSFDSETCYDQAEPAGGLSHLHFLGTGDRATSVLSGFEEVKSIQIKVFEIHVNRGEVQKCFRALPNEIDGSGSTQVKIRQDVSNEDSECHPNRGGGATCDFQVTLDDSGYLIFPNSGESTWMNISAGQPNLAGTHRRTVRIEVERNDLYRSVTATVVRELIPLGAKPRGGDGTLGEDATFWATVPLEGLVYTVVHDPPGGNSYSEVKSGTSVAIKYALSETRAASVGGDYTYKGAAALGTSFELGFNLGYTAEVSNNVLETDAKYGSDIEYAVTAPTFSVKGGGGGGWDIQLITARALRSSNDPALPGRPGDGILGGGVEILYQISDVLDLSREQGGKVCLDVREQITWLPRQPTTYFVTVHAVSAQMIPNLQYLQSLAASGSINGTGIIDRSGRPIDAEKTVAEDWAVYLQQKIDAWSRTLEWSSPSTSSVDLQAAYSSSKSVFGAHLAEKFGDYNEELSDYNWSDADGPATELANRWAEGAGLDILAGIPIVAVSAALAVTGGGGWSPAVLGGPALFLASMGLQPVFGYASEARLLPYIENGDEKISILNPRSDAELPDYGKILSDGDNGLYYSFGVSNVAKGALRRDYGGEGALRQDSNKDKAGDENKYLDVTDTKRVIASLTGGVGPVGMSGSSENAEILLTFTGGGQSLDFSFSSDEELESKDHQVELEMSGGFKFGATLDAKSAVKGGIAISTDGSGGMSSTWSRSVGSTRAFMWNKRGQLTSSYSLGDPEYGDKFVVSISSDARFGTPVFVTKGGRSMCPGETGTVFRESGVALEIPLATKMNTANLNPGQRAVFEVVIRNESPYREAGKFALRLVDGLAASLSELVSAARTESSDANADASAVLNRVKSVGASVFAKDSDDVKRVIEAATSAAASEGANAGSVAASVYTAASAAPREGSEFGDSVFTINGNRLSIGDYMPFKFVGGDSLDRQKFVSQQHLNFAVTPGYATRDVKYLQLRLQSLCETDMDLYRDPISYTQNMDAMSWSQPCPKAQFDESTIAKYLFSSQSPSSSGELNLKVNNPDQYVLWPEAGATKALMNTRLKFVRLQYRPVSGGEWITAKDEGSNESDKKFNLLCDDSRTEGCKFDWKINNQYEKLLSGFKDNVYEMRVKNFCFGGPSLADPSVHEYVGDQRLTLTVDTQAPMETGRFESRQEFFGMNFNEPIDCSEQKVSVQKIQSSCGDSQQSAHLNVDLDVAALRAFKFTCTNNAGGFKFTVAFPENESGRYRITVNGIKDSAMNPARAFSIVADVHCSAAKVSSVSSLGAGAPSDASVRVRDIGLRMGRFETAATMVALAALATALARRRRAATSEHLSVTTPASYGSLGSTI